jgi:chaperone modulatory protein CbpM
LRPIAQPTGWYFEEIDVARLQLLCQLTQDININDDGMDVVLALLDQLYSARVQMQKLLDAIAGQPKHVQVEIKAIITH